MEIIIVDDEDIILSGEQKLVQKCVPNARVQAFRSPEEALEYLRRIPVDVVFLDIEMPGYDGVTLAKKMKLIRPRVNIIFATAYRDYYEAAMSLRVSGYLLKPLKETEVLEELENLRFPLNPTNSGLFVRTFGSFEVFYDGRPLLFRYQKTKELFAYLIDRRGSMVSRDELITILWGGETERDSYYKQIQKDLSDTLCSIGKGDILIKQRGSVGVLANLINCDYYEWLEGSAEGVTSFFGEYMRQYDWAEETLANIEGRKNPCI